MNKITENLWISDIESTQTQDTSRFDCIISVCQDSVQDNVSCINPQFNLSDGQNSSGERGMFTYELFEEACSEVLQRMKNGEIVLVHCHAGVSRSSSVCIAVLGVLNNTNWTYARSIVEDARPIINPNPDLIPFIKRYIEENSS